MGFVAEGNWYVRVYQGMGWIREGGLKLEIRGLFVF